SGADHLGFGVSPGGGVTGQALSPSVTVQVLDQFGNVVAGDNGRVVTVAVASGPGAIAAGSTTMGSDIAGVATFSNLVLTASGGYTLSATTPGLPSATSAAFTVGAFADNFNRPNSSTLGPNWTTVTGTVGVLSNQLAVTGSGIGLAVYNTVPLGSSYA